jgi:hypothetical protein
MALNLRHRRYPFDTPGVPVFGEGRLGSRVPNEHSNAAIR